MPVPFFFAKFGERSDLSMEKERSVNAAKNYKKVYVKEIEADVD